MSDNNSFLKQATPISRMPPQENLKIHLIEPKSMLDEKALTKKNAQSDDDSMLQLFLSKTSQENGYRELLTEFLQNEKSSNPLKHISMK